ncbi:MAG: MATE family efflux transporter, partial [Spirochaetales bacterium]|nr:MATE family efflux transporter [Candidatus Physcosoma equi]
SVVDTMVAGYNLGDGAIAAIGATAALYSLFIHVSLGLNRGFAIVVTQSYGAKREEDIKASIASTILLNAFVTVVLTTITCTFMHPFLKMMKTPTEIYQDTYNYIIVICAGMVATIAFNMFSSILNAFGNSRTSNIYLIVSSLLNIVLDLLFIMVFHMGVQGAAWATVISALISAVLSGWYFFRNYKEVLPERRHWRINRRIMKEMITVGMGMALMITAVDIGTMIFQGANNGLGTLYITAHTTARRIIVLLMQPQTSLYLGVATFVGQNWGAGNRKRIAKNLPKGVGMVVVWDFIAILSMFLFASPLVRLMTGTTDKEVLRLAVLSIHLNVILFPFCGVLCTLRAVLQSMGIKVRPVLCSIIELVMKVISAIWIVPKVGFLAVCVTEPATWVVCAIFIVVVYLTERKRLLIFKNIETEAII